MFYLSSPVPSDVLEEGKERNKTDNAREGWEEKRKKENGQPKGGMGWEDGTSPPHRDFKERGVMR